MSFKCCFGFFEALNFNRNIFDRSNSYRSNSYRSNSDQDNSDKSTFDNKITKIKNPRQILSSNYIRLLIEKHYEPTLNWFDFASISGIAAFLQREYSSLINSEMVYEALLLEPHYKISHRMDAPGCRFIRHKI